MYSLVLMMALGNGSAVPGFDEGLRAEPAPYAQHGHQLNRHCHGGRRERRCHGRCSGGGCWGGGGCSGSSYGCSGGHYGAYGGYSPYMGSYYGGSYSNSPYGQGYYTAPMPRESGYYGEERREERFEGDRMPAETERGRMPSDRGVAPSDRHTLPSDRGSTQPERVTPREGDRTNPGGSKPPE
jgi:hypothetical protein